MSDENTPLLTAEKRGLSVADGSRSVELAELAADARRYVASTRSPATQRAYRRDWRTWVEFCQTASLEPLPASPESIVLFLAELVRRGRRLATIERALAALSVAHQAAGIFEPPTRDRLVANAMKGIRRELARLGRSAPVKKLPLVTDVIVAILRELDVSTLAGQRDAALLSVGVSSALRREELARVRVEHLRLVEQGIELTIPYSKTDQEGVSCVIPIAFGATPHTCPVRTLQRWLAAAGIDSGPIFRAVTRHDCIGGPLSPRAISEIAKRSAARVGLDPKDFGGHSLRSGFATSAARAGKNVAAIQRITRHRDLDQVAGYIRSATLFDDAGNANIGL